MKNQFIHKFILIYFISFFIIYNIYGQLQINTSMTPTQLVQNVLIGAGVTATNITYTGAPTAIAAFTTGSNPTSLGITDGILLTTGNPMQVAQAATSLNMTTSLNTPGDADLDNLTTGTTKDACVLQFDFIPLSDTIKFRYVFGSEEYPEWVNSSYNDVFGFFISGANPSGGNYSNHNIALIPGTNTPITINNVNMGHASGCSSPQTGCTNCAYYVNNCNSTSIVFDGLTTVLTAWCKVTPCQTYHIKLAIADVADGAYDSGVFLEASSFSTNALTVTQLYSNPLLGNNAIEGCSNGIFAITTPSPVSSPLTIAYTLGGTAINGTDYTNIPNTITIPAGQDSATIIIDALLDNLTEGTETVTLTFTNVCSTQVYTISIIDNIPLTLTTSGSTTICSGDSTSISLNINGGLLPYSYNWSGGLGTDSIVTVSPTSTTTYSVTVSDNCGQTATDTVTVNIANNISISISPPNPSICPGENITLTATGASNYLWSPSTGLSSATGALVTANPITTTTYTLIGTNTAGCSGSTNITVNVANSLSATASSTDETCNQMNGTATANTVDSCSQGYTYLWSTTPPQTTQTAINLSAGTYNVTVSCNSCSTSVSVNVINIPGAEAGFSSNPKVLTPYDGPVSFIDNSSGNIVSWQWNFGDGATGTGNSTLHNYENLGTYTVVLIITDLNGCTDTVSDTIVVKDIFTLYIPNTFTPNDDEKNDFFSPQGVNVDPNNFEMTIFDRWGNIMFHTTKWQLTQGEPWNGTKNNNGTINDLLMDVYVYRIKVKEIKGPRHEYVGRIFLLP